MYLTIGGLMIAALFPGFRQQKITVSGASINAIVGGKGPPLLLLHGWPQNLLEWHHVASRLARDFTVVATDLRGYGDSGKPDADPQHQNHCKRAMAKDQVEVMHHLSFEEFFVVGHDRGGRVAHRMALDRPDSVLRLAVLDIVPTLTVYSTVTKELATAYYHWFFLIQPAPIPETLLAGRGEFMLKNLFRGLSKDAMPAEIFSDYVRCFNDPATLQGMCEDYRAAASIDLDHDRADLNKKIECPLLVLWGEKGAMHQLYDVLATWRERATEVTGRALSCGHWIPEEAPDAVYEQLRSFFIDR
jgi:haloacetate dehalogenase